MTYKYKSIGILTESTLIRSRFFYFLTETMQGTVFFRFNRRLKNLPAVCI